MKLFGKTLFERKQPDPAPEYAILSIDNIIWENARDFGPDGPSALAQAGFANWFPSPVFEGGGLTNRAAPDADQQKPH